MSDNPPVKTDKLKAYGELLNDIPKVTVSAWGNDFGLGLAHRNAVKLAYEIASYYTQEQRDKTLSEILRILYLWKNEYGVYPAYSYIQNNRAEYQQVNNGTASNSDTSTRPPARVEKTFSTNELLEDKIHEQEWLDTRTQTEAIRSD